jgi:hypothetical protein
MNVVGFFSGTVLPNELGDTYQVVSAMNWDYATTAALAEMFALIFQDPPVDMGRFTTEELKGNTKSYRWFIQPVRPVTGGINQQLSGFPHRGRLPGILPSFDYCGDGSTVRCGANGCPIAQIYIYLFLASVILGKEKISPLSGKALFHFRGGTVSTVKHAYGTEKQLGHLR